MSYNLFLDDSRNPRDVKWVELPLVAWTVVRNYREFVETIQRDGVPRIVSFDHDLADEHYKEFARATDPKTIDKQIKYETLTEKTGYDCAKWLANFCVDKGIPIPLYYLHSLNGIGCANIHSILESARKVMNEGTSGNPTGGSTGERQDDVG
ncbi:hypothetical protein E2P64_06230 [Candidatus Bathyarchaeota archaeon]|nr:hypothetical protein E2P64_06230 [Candidatus Bathyarchaeota archaeon]